MQGGNGKRHPRFRDDSVARLKMPVPEQALFLCRGNGKRNIRVLAVKRTPVVGGGLDLIRLKGNVLRPFTQYSNESIMSSFLSTIGYLGRSCRIRPEYSKPVIFMKIPIPNI